MSTYNVWLNTTAHNISNVKTVGYTRQTVNQAAGKPISFGTRYHIGIANRLSALCGIGCPCCKVFDGLVDTNDHYTISYEVNGVKHSQNDIDKLYDLRWSNGQ